MQSDLLQPPSGLASSPPEAPSRVKFRVRFRKAGDLRFVSHHDLMHIFERTFRRAGLSLPVTQGFNPRPRMWFALSLALGIPGLNEVLELELSEPLGATEVQRRLTAHAPPGIDIREVRSIDVRASAHVRRAWYRMPLPASPELRHSCEEFLGRGECWIARQRPRPRRVNLRPFVSELCVSAHGLDMALWITSNGAARPEEIVAALGLTAALDDSAVIERTDLEIIDELPAGTTGVPAIETAFEEIGTNDRVACAEAASAPRPTAIIEDPLSFES